MKKLEHTWRDDPRIQKVKGTFEVDGDVIPLLVPWEWFDWVFFIPRFIILITLYTVILVLQITMRLSGWVRKLVHWCTEHPWLNLQSAKRAK